MDSSKSCVVIGRLENEVGLLLIKLSKELSGVSSPNFSTGHHFLGG